MNHRPTPPLVAFACAAATLAGCASAPKSPFRPVPPAKDDTIRHVVLVQLDDPQLADELIHDMDRLLPPIPGVVSYWRGSPHLSDRPEVRQDYDVGLVLDFRDDSAYAKYIASDRHEELLATWKPRVTNLVIYDIGSCASWAQLAPPFSKVDPYSK